MFMKRIRELMLFHSPDLLSPDYNHVPRHFQHNNMNIVTIRIVSCRMISERSCDTENRSNEAKKISFASQE